MKILLIEDDEILADRLVQSLTQRQYVVDAIADGQDGLEYAQSTSYDLIISDVGLPSMDGITLCSRLRQEGNSTPILLMTAKDAPDERIRGLDAGADDHLTKPLNLEEMHARVRALLRRGQVAPETVLQAGPLRLDPVSCQVTFGEQLLKLTPKEYSLLELFMRSPNRVFSRSHIVEHLWSFDDPPLEDSVKAHIKGLRRKLKQVGAVGWIDNVYGIGYRFRPQLEASSSATPSAVTKAAASQESLSSSPSRMEQAFQESMVGLWGKYQDLMSDRIRTLTQVAQAIAVGTPSPEVLATAATAAHKLAGVLGMFELDEGSDLARDLEIRLETPTAAALAAVPELVQRLVELIRIAPTTPIAPVAEKPSYSLLISGDMALAAELRQLGQAAHCTWQQVGTIAEAETLIQQSPPDIVVVDIAAASLWSATVAFVQQLSQRLPTIPSIALTTTDSLMDRVAIAQAGLHRLLMKPITAEQILSVTTQLQRHTRGVTAQILVVDDDPLILQALRPLLEPWGLGITALATPHQFWEVLQSTQPDLLILDVEMPDFSGIELCQAIRITPEWQNLPVLFLTAHRDAETLQAVFRAGADDFIAKPIVGPELLTRILNRLERHHLQQLRSHQDTLTGLPNYLASKQALLQLLEDAQLATLVLIRVGDLTAIAHQQGPDARLTVLRAWGQCFQSFEHSIGPIGYWGHGEFVIGIPAALTNAQEMVAPLLQMLRRQIVTLSTGERLQPVVESALVEYPGDGQTLPQLYRTALTQL